LHRSRTLQEDDSNQEAEDAFGMGADDEDYEATPGGRKRGRAGSHRANAGGNSSRSSKDYCGFKDAPSLHIIAL